MKSNLQLLKLLADESSTVAVLDDFFPNILTGFRVAEYNWYLENIAKLRIYSTNPNFEAVHAEYSKIYPQYADRVLPFDAASSLSDCAVAIINFLNNAYYFLPSLEQHCIPFLITLYPGGGFGLQNPESDAKLDRVLCSPMLLGIIATQNVTLEYLKEKNCKVPVYDMYGGAINPIYFDGELNDKRFSDSSRNINICFVAERYMPMGENKGYPQFIEAAQQLIEKYPDLRFSVVGNFNTEVCKINEQLSEAIKFYGTLKTADLRNFFLEQHIIISPNKPHLLYAGNFDGFPTGCCVEASLCGVAVVCSDELKLNRYYTDRLNIVICEPSAIAIVESVIELISNPALLNEVASNGSIISRDIFDPVKQLGARLKLVHEIITENEAQWANNLTRRYRSNIRTISDQLNQVTSLEVELASRVSYIAVQAKEINCRDSEIAMRDGKLIEQAKHISKLEAEILRLKNSFFRKVFFKVLKFLK